MKPEAKEVIKMVSSLKPGESIEFYERGLLLAIPGYRYNGVFFTPADRVLENIIGSGFEFNYRQNLMKGTLHSIGLKSQSSTAMIGN